ncbi:hypothetical protein AXF42_Ash008174 [Apostasia shenzhenica]|uniref:Uncharacterized protein n=1 Tax=Apostasia shenzhenica TaxID=1088818 RepID=A0A2I0A8U7_9ASPA|nr:hypothetical protein AXF42_Ash008174 [Apostasia shenzhenica]
MASTSGHLLLFLLFLRFFSSTVFGLLVDIDVYDDKEFQVKGAAALGVYNNDPHRVLSWLDFCRTLKFEKKVSKKRDGDEPLELLVFATPVGESAPAAYWVSVHGNKLMGIRRADEYIPEREVVCV